MRNITISATILSALAVVPPSMTQCPVCESDVEASNPDETDYREESFGGPQVEHEGETYVFCCEEHREAFEENPEEYV